MLVTDLDFFAILAGFEVSKVRFIFNWAKYPFIIIQLPC
jgi:hypothetical protein